MTEVASETIEQIAPDRLKSWARNARTHSKKQLRQIADSIRAFGFTNPVLIDEEGTILAGHGRVAAAKLMGIESNGMVLAASVDRCGHVESTASDRSSTYRHECPDRRPAEKQTASSPRRPPVDRRDTARRSPADFDSPCPSPRSTTNRNSDARVAGRRNSSA